VVGGETEKKTLMGYFGFAGVTSGVIWDGASQNERFRSRCGCREAEHEAGQA
jgi:hypothetical protein